MTDKKRDFHAHTIRANGGLLRDLKSEIRVCAAFDPAVTDPASAPKLQGPFIGLWDTGATGSVVSQKIVDACGLQPISMMKVIGAYGGAPHDRPAFMVNIMLPQGVGVSGMTVTLGEPVGADALIGMDIITLGDFAITNENGQTTFSFRVPSCHTIDYVKQAEQIRESRQLELARKQRGGKPAVNPGARRKGGRR